MGRMKAVGLCWSFPSGPVTTTQVQLHKTACSGTLCFLYIGLGAPLLSCRWQGFWGNIFCPPIFRVSRMECITSNICDIISKGKVALAFLLTISRNYVPSPHPHHFFFFWLAWAIRGFWQNYRQVDLLQPSTASFIWGCDWYAACI